MINRHNSYILFNCLRNLSKSSLSSQSSRIFSVFCNLHCLLQLSIINAFCYLHQSSTIPATSIAPNEPTSPRIRKRHPRPRCTAGISTGGFRRISRSWENNCTSTSGFRRISHPWEYNCTSTGGFRRISRPWEYNRTSTGGFPWESRPRCTTAPSVRLSGKPPDGWA